MFIKEIITEPRYVDSWKFVERTVESKFNRGEASITTIYMNDKPIIKKYTFTGKNILKHFWKTLKNKEVREETIDKSLNILV